MASRADDGGGGAAPSTPAGIHDVARLAGVSTATVSRALRGLDRVRPETRRRVILAAETLSYAASPSAASLATGRTGVVAVIVPFVSRWFFSHVLEAVERGLRAAGLHVLLLTVGDAPHGRVLLRERHLLHRRVDALLVLSCDLHPEEVALLRSLAVPVVTVGIDVPGWHLVGIDDEAAGATAMQHLLELGHRRIAYVGGDSEHDVHVATAVDRGAGLRRAVKEAGLSTGTLRSYVGDWTVESGRLIGERLLRSTEPPTAVLAASDEMAIGVLCAARAARVAVPQELSVVGIDDHEMAVTHELTTVHQPVDELGLSAAALLVEALGPGSPDTERPRRLVVHPTHLVVRASTARVPGQRQPSAASAAGRA